jgi:DNA polymerase-3 subunit chi
VTQVDFYVLTAAASHQGRARFACRLAEKAWKKGYRVFIHTSSEFEAQQLDDLLWTFRAESFVPHAIATDPRDAALPVLVGTGSEPALPLDLLVNLSDTVPAYFQRFARLAEIVEPNDTQREIARSRYRHYREQGCRLRSHNV